MTREHLALVIKGGIAPGVVAIVLYAALFAHNDEKTFFMSFANAILNAVQVWALVFYIPGLIDMRRVVRRVNPRNSERVT